MGKFYCVIRENATSSANGIYDDIEDAKQAAADASKKHLENDRYFVMESICYMQANVSMTEGDV